MNINDDHIAIVDNGEMITFKDGKLQSYRDSITIEDVMIDGLGIGDGCEYPILNETSTVVLQNGMMMSCEPGIYLPGIGGIRIEDDVVIRDGIGVVMNRTSKELLILKEDAAHEV